MRILDWNTLDKPQRLAALARPRLKARAEASRAAMEIVAKVRISGDAAVRSFTQDFDGVALDSLRVPATQVASARGLLTADQIQALKRAIENVRTFHQAQLPRPLSLETEPGMHCEQLLRPVSRVGLYVPSGSAPLPSALIMLAVPAEVAGCLQRIVCTPPRTDGSVHPSILVAAELCGIDTVFRVGGAQAIAAMAYGTESIPRVDKIFGPGNAWVTAAKQLIAQDPSGAPSDLPAGPSEVMVIADESARAEFVAADLLAQLEHDPLSQGILITPSAALARAVGEETDTQAARLSRISVLLQSLASCRAIVVDDLATAFQLSNEYAPEHLILAIESPRQWLGEVRSAGCVFLGHWTPESLGDYCAGPNHVLPTYGHARAISGLSVRDFLKVISVQEATRPALTRLGPTAATLADLEGLDGHAQAVSRRLRVLESAGLRVTPDASSEAVRP
jgi:histidinol dehydrogenase